MEPLASQHSPDFYRELLDNVSEYIYSVYHENGVPVATYHSPSCLKITGYSVSDFYRDTSLWYTMIHPLDRESVTEGIDDILKTGGQRSFEHRIVHRNGSVRWVSNITTVICNDSENKIIMNGFIHDITEKKQAEDRIATLISAVEQSPSTVVITDVEGNIEYANPKFTRLTGYTLDEAAGKNPRILKSGSHSEEFYRTLWNTIRGGSEWRGEFQNRKKNGEYYWEHASISPIKDSAGTVTHFVAVKEDITDRKRIEDALRTRNETLEKDLKMAQIIQKAFLPQLAPRMPRIETEFRFLPLEKIGGDFFSFSPLGDQSLGVFLGDVAGHGISSALFLTLIKSETDRILHSHWDDPARYLSELNTALSSQMNSHFITALYILFSFAKVTTMTFANGGHPKPVIYRAADESYFQIKSKGTIVGSFDNAVYEKKTLELQPGDRVYIFTDGIPESENSSREMIGFEDGLLSLFQRAYSPSLSETLDTVLDEITVFSGGKPHEDDIVLIGFEIKR